MLCSIMADSIATWDEKLNNVEKETDNEEQLKLRKITCTLERQKANHQWSKAYETAEHRSARLAQLQPLEKI